MRLLFLGKTLEVLLEEEVEIDGKAYYLGHTREYVKVAVPKTEEYGVNDILAVKVEKTLSATYSAGRRNTGSVGVYTTRLRKEVLQN